MAINYASYPLKDIPQPHAHDVLCGRGGGTNNHIGNSHWRMLVAANKQLYITLPKRQKMLLSRSIVNAVRSQNPPGRFLQKDNKSSLWFDVGDQRAQEKTSQALREGAPDIRKKVAAAKEGEESAVSATNQKGDSTNEGGKSASDKNNQNYTKSPHTVSDASKEAVPSVSLKEEGSNTTASIKQPSRSSAGSTGSGRMPIPQYFPNSSGGGSFSSNPLQQQQQNMAMFAGQNNPAMLQMMYQTMMMNGGGDSNNVGQGMMTPQQQQMMQMMMAAGMGNNNNNNPHMSPQVSGAGSTATQMASNMGQQQNYQQQQQQQHQDSFEPYPVNHGSASGARPAGQSIPTFDEFVLAPESLEPAGLSYGSMSMSDAEMRRLQAGGHSFGSAAAAAAAMRLSFGSNNSGHGMNPHAQQQQQQLQQQMHNHHTNTTNNNANNNDNAQQQEGAPAALDGLEPTGISFGDISMMSAGTNLMKLDGTGTSFGTMMSYNTIKADMVDGGLMDAVGTSFGSLSLDPKNREALFRTLEMTGGGDEVPPMFHSEEKAKGNLLDCSDTESENSADKHKLTQQKSQAWERMKLATETKLKEQISKGSVASQDLMPPPVGMTHHPSQQQQSQQQQASNAPTSFVDSEVTIPTTALENNFSTLSAWSAADDFDADADAASAEPPQPPQQLKKEDSW